LVLIVFLALAGCARPVDAGAEAVLHPDRAGAKIEYFLRRPKGAGPWPTLVFLHGHQPLLSRSGGRAFVTWGVLDRVAKQGYLAVSVSLPGYGGSSGPQDFAGPFSQHAVEAVLAKIESEGLAAPDKILIQGVSLGAVTGAFVAAHRPRLAGLVLISGLYDLPAFLAHPKTSGAEEIKAAIMRQTDGSEAALRLRSAIRVAASINASTLILNGAKDDRTDPDQAVRLAAMIKKHGGKAEVRVYPEFGHEIPVKAREAEIDAFIARTLKPDASTFRCATPQDAPPLIPEPNTHCSNGSVPETKLVARSGVSTTE